MDDIIIDDVLVVCLKISIERFCVAASGGEYLGICKDLSIRVTISEIPPFGWTFTHCTQKL